MIDKLLNALGYAGTDIVITRICAMASCVLAICLAYTVIDFLFNLVLSIVGRDRNIKL